MRIVEITESAVDESKIRRLAYQIIRGLKSTAQYGFRAAVLPWDHCLLYLPTIFPDLVIGFMTNMASPSLSENIQPSTLPRRYRYVLSFPIEDNRTFSNIRDAHLYAQKLLKDPKLSPQRLLDLLRTEAPTLVHELTHYWDRKRGGVSSEMSDEYIAASDPDSADKTPYFNNVLERNAYYQEAVSQIAHRPPSFFQKDFPSFLKAIMGFFNEDFIGSLTEPNRRRLIQRLHQLWRHKQLGD